MLSRRKKRNKGKEANNGYEGIEVKEGNKEREKGIKTRKE